MNTQTNLHSKAVLYMSMELSSKTWKIGFMAGQKMRRVTVPAGARAALISKIMEAKGKLGLASDTEVYSCYEAGRDGFWIHRWLLREGVHNLVVDPASIEVSRRYRRVKTDRLDADKLVVMLWRYYQLNERAGWKIVRVPSEIDEDARRADRELTRLKKERSAHQSRIKSLLVTQGISVKHVRRLDLETVHDWQGQKLGSGLCAELQREQQRLEGICVQIREIEDQHRAALNQPQTTAQRVAAKLYQLRSIGEVSAYGLSHEFFAWRQFRNVRQVGGLAGLTGTPYNSGDGVRDQGISKAGNRRVRTLAIELAWINRDRPSQSGFRDVLLAEESACGV
jgi:transposase